MKILARNIANLTDARYFASRFVDMMAMPWKGGQQDHELWQAMRSWIDGVTWCLQLDHASLEAQNFIQANNVQHCLVRDAPMTRLPKEVQQWVQMESHRALSDIKTTSTHPSVKSLILPFSLYLRLDQGITIDNVPIWLAINSPEEVMKLRNEPINVEGIALTGSPEEETGIKSYEVMDAIFDAIDFSWPESS